MKDLLWTVKKDDTAQRIPLVPRSGDGSDEEKGLPDDMQNFLRNEAEVRADMEHIQAIIQDLNGLNERSKAVVQAADIEQLRLEMQRKLDDAYKTSANIKSRLQTMQITNNDVEGRARNSANHRIKANVTGNLSKQLQAMMTKLFELRTTFHTSYREVVQRRVYTVTGKQIGDDDADKLIESGGGEQIFSTAIQQQGRGRLLDTIAEINERHKSAQGLETSLLELCELFRDMSTLIVTQGVMVASIAKNVEETKHHVNEAAVELVQANQLQSASRRWACWAYAILAVIIVAVVLAVVLTLKLWESNGGHSTPTPAPSTPAAAPGNPPAP